jgi:hypothetical protein
MGVVTFPGAAPGAQPAPIPIAMNSGGTGGALPIAGAAPPVVMLRVYVNIYINKDNLPADFDMAAVKKQIEETLGGVKAKTTIILTDREREDSDNLGVVYIPRPPVDKGGTLAPGHGSGDQRIRRV